jgi:WD domain, G-beta repeat
MNKAKPRSHGGPLRLLQLFVPAMFVLAALCQLPSQAIYADDQPPAGANNEAGIASALKRLSTVGNQDTESDASAMQAYSTLGLASEQNPHQKVDGFYARQDIPLDEEVKRSLGADLILRDVEDCRKNGKSNDECLKEAVSKMKALGGKPEILDRLVASMEKSPLEMLRARKPLSVSPEPEWPVVKPERGPTGEGGTTGPAKPGGATTLTLKGHTDSVGNGTFTSDGLMLATTSRDKTVRLWNTQTGALIRTLEGYGTGSVVFSQDGKTGASESIEDRDGRNYYTVRVWEVQTGALTHTLDLQQGPLAFSPDGNTLATQPLSNGPKGISLWDVQTGGLRQTLSLEPFLYPYSVRDVLFSPDGNMLVVGTGLQSRSGEIVLADVRSGTLKQRLAGHHANIVQKVAISPDGSMVASASLDTTGIIWDLQTGQPTQTLKDLGLPTIVAFSPDGKTLASVGLNGSVQLWNAKTGAPTQRIGVSAVAIIFLSDGKTMLVANSSRESFDKDVLLQRVPVN